MLNAPAAAAVVNDEKKLAARALPAASFTQVGQDGLPFTSTAYTVPAVSREEGSRVNVTPDPVTAAPMRLAASQSLKLPVLTVDASMGSLKVTITLAPVETPVTPLAGATDNTVGGVVSAPAAVVNDEKKLAAMALPAASSTQVGQDGLPFTSTEYTVPAVSREKGSRVNVVPDPVTAAPMGPPASKS